MGNYAAKYWKSNYKEFENFINLHVRVSILNKFPASFLSALFGFINYFHFKTIDVVCAYLPGFILYFTFFLFYIITNSIFIKKAVIKKNGLEIINPANAPKKSINRLIAFWFFS